MSDSYRITKTGYVKGSNAVSANEEEEEEKDKDKEEEKVNKKDPEPTPTPTPTTPTPEIITPSTPDTVEPTTAPDLGTGDGGTGGSEKNPEDSEEPASEGAE